MSDIGTFFFGCLSMVVGLVIGWITIELGAKFFGNK